MAATWFTLVAVAVLGRLWQPAPNVTPLAGVAIAAGTAFPNPLVAASVPAAALALGNLAAPAYGNGPSGFAMAAVVCAALTWPVLFGSLVRRSPAGSPGRLLSAAGGGLASSLVFFFSTNVAHWYLMSDYPRSPAGLWACLVAGLPFHRWMPVGDAAWSVALVAGLALLGRFSTAQRPVSTERANAA